MSVARKKINSTFVMFYISRKCFSDLKRMWKFSRNGQRDDTHFSYGLDFVGQYPDRFASYGVGYCVVYCFRVFPQPS